ncbi:hypothetical protein ACIP6X_02385 [Streptomyces coeruleorubidus]|uniref:hypothetical protein n=1 Tax=Streptomyces coeruleorubidus TaxID=116188 RepID=UPI003806EF79
MSTPIWWPGVLAAAGQRRIYTDELLAHATPTVVGGTLRLHFDRADIAAAWRDSGAQAALEGAMEHCGVDLTVEVNTAISRSTCKTF